MVRPEQIRLAASPGGKPSSARVVAVTYYGHDASVRLALNGRPETVVARVPGHRTPALGDEVRLAVEGAVMAYPRALSDAGQERAEPRSAAQLPEEPTSAAALGNEESLS